MRSEVFYNKPIVKEVFVFENIKELIRRFDTCKLEGKRVNFIDRLKPDAFTLCAALFKAYKPDEKDFKLEYGYYTPSGNLKIPHAWIRCIHSGSIIDLQQPFTLSDPIYIDMEAISKLSGDAKTLYASDKVVYDKYMSRNQAKYHTQVELISSELRRLMSNTKSNT